MNGDAIIDAKIDLINDFFESLILINLNFNSYLRKNVFYLINLKKKDILENVI